MKKKSVVFALMSMLLGMWAVSVVSCSGGEKEPDLPDEPDVEVLDEEALRKNIAQMLIIGFEGSELTTSNHIYRDIVEYGIGGVIVYEYKGNIVSKTQLATLCADLQKASGGKLLISIDQEGGKVSRLNAKYGYPTFPSAQVLGEQEDEETTKWGEETALALKEAGVNLNFAPVVDVNVNPKSPAIGALGRSFSADPEVVARKAALWIAAHSKSGVISCAKHFPGHGSSTADSHLGLTDVTSTWQDYELIPYQRLLASNQLDMVMVGHMFNTNLDAIYPASLSKSTIQSLLREKIGFQGVVITDDLGMGALTKQYGYSEILELAINAGVDMLCISNGTNPPNVDIVPQTINTVVQKVKEGKISASRIAEAAARVAALKKRL